jgi:SAM-dependent methyltransferase
MDRDGWNQRYETTDLVWTAEPNQFLVAEVEGLAPGTALDLGAGEGRNAVWLAQQGWQVTAVDFSDVGLAKADQLAAAAGVEMSTTCADLIGYRPPPRTFDLVAVLYVHLPASVRRAVNRRAVDAVAPGGTLLVVGHDTTNPTDGYGGPQNPDVLFSPDDVVADLAGSGLVVEKAERVPRPVTTEDGPRVAIDALVRAWRPEEP